jgi:EmrB/QacA subfamily drug resistance transporter
MSTSATRRPGLILAFLCIAGFMTFLDVSIVNVALPTIEHALNLPEAVMEYIVTTYGTVLGGCLLLGGRLADTVGRRRMLRWGLVIFALASLAAGLATGSVMLVIARGAQGLGSALIAPAALSLLTATFEEGPARTRALGVWGGLSGIAAVFGVVLGGLLTQGPGWRWIFFVNVPIGLAAAAAAALIVPESRDTASRRRFDTAGAVALTAALVLLIFTLGQTLTWTWGSPKTIGCLAVTGVLLGIFVAIERRAEAPLVPLSIFRRRTLRTANIAAAAMLGALVTLFFFASLDMQQVLGYGPLRTGLSYIPIALIVAVGAGVSQGLVQKVSVKPVMVAGMALATIGLVLLWRTPVNAGYYANLLPDFLIAGLGFGLAFVPIQVAAFADFDERDSGLAAGLINTSQEAGGALGVAVAGTIAFVRVPALTRWAGSDHARLIAARASVYHEAFLIAACFVFAGLLTALTLPRLRDPERAPAEPASPEPAGASSEPAGIQPEPSDA